MLKTQPRGLMSPKLAIPRKARKQASCTMSSASLSLRASQRASA